jgi:predicted nucleotidyltransferase
MSRDWEQTFSGWGGAPSATEQTKAENAVRAVRKAIDASTKLSAKSIDVFTQGSYANRTNVRQDSDVDVCVLYTGAFFPDYSLSAGLSDPVLGYSVGTYPYAEFKNDVEAALVSYFDRTSVTRGKKAFDVGTPQSHWYESPPGTEFYPDNGGTVVNWPRQNYTNGVVKNDATGRRFKAVTRILKRLRNEMVDAGYEAAKPIASYLIECLVWNVPNEGFGHTTFKADVRYAIAHLWNETRTDESCKSWREINALKWLFFIGHPWSRAQVNTFLHAAWNYVGFE